MPDFTLSIRCDNAAFEGVSLAPEIARILRDAARRIEDYGFEYHEHALRDTNGNRVGSYRLEGTDDLEDEESES